MHKDESDLTQKYLKSILHYGEKTGVFTWLETGKGRKADKSAGYLCSTWGYVIICIEGRDFRAHRLAHLYVTGAFPEYETDHKDHNRKNNMWNNIRDVKHSDNLKNQSLRSTNKTGINGVSKIANKEKWRAGIQVNGKQIAREFHTLEEAVTQRRVWDKEYGFHKNHGMTI